MHNKPVYRRYVIGDQDKTEFGLCYDEKNIKLEVKKHEDVVMIIVDECCYNTGSCLVDDKYFERMPRKKYSQ